jgi:hypothetical protein
LRGSFGSLLHLIQCGLIGILDIADYRPFCREALSSGDAPAGWERKAQVWSW